MKRKCLAKTTKVSHVILSQCGVQVCRIISWSIIQVYSSFYVQNQCKANGFKEIEPFLTSQQKRTNQYKRMATVFTEQSLRLYMNMTVLYFITTLFPQKSWLKNSRVGTCTKMSLWNSERWIGWKQNEPSPTNENYKLSSRIIMTICFYVWRVVLEYSLLARLDLRRLY